RIESIKPDVILLDIDLGGESGIRAIPEFQARSPARVLILTGSGDVACHDEAVLAGACGVITKDNTSDVIVKAIEKASAGEVWLDRAAAGRIFVTMLSRQKKNEGDPMVSRLESFTARERQIAAELASDTPLPTKKIAARLSIAESTLRNHITTIYG